MIAGVRTVPRELTEVGIGTVGDISMQWALISWSTAAGLLWMVLYQWAEHLVVPLPGEVESTGFGSRKDWVDTISGWSHPNVLEVRGN
jgi:hypothetical protein